jgi:hypothetical protein
VPELIVVTAEYDTRRTVPARPRVARASLIGGAGAGVTAFVLGLVFASDAVPGTAAAVIIGAMTYAVYESEQRKRPGRAMRGKIRIGEDGLYFVDPWMVLPYSRVLGFSVEDDGVLLEHAGENGASRSMYLHLAPAADVRAAAAMLRAGMERSRGELPEERAVLAQRLKIKEGEDAPAWGSRVIPLWTGFTGFREGAVDRQALLGVATDPRVDPSARYAACKLLQAGVTADERCALAGMWKRTANTHVASAMRAIEEDVKEGAVGDGIDRSTVVNDP